MQSTAGRTSIVGLFDTTEHAQEAVRALVDEGISRQDISLVAKDRSTHSGHGSHKRDTTDGSSVGENVAGGALFGGLGGLLIGLGALAIPGIGPIVAAGPIATTLAGAGVGALGGGIVGAIKDAGVPDEDAHVYAEGVRRGGCMLVVRTDGSMVDRVSDVMERYHAIDVDERANQFRSSGWNRFDESADAWDESGASSGAGRGPGSMAGNSGSTPSSTTGTTDSGINRRRVRTYPLI